MKAFIYNLLSKGLLILLLLALAAGYYYRAELFPQFFANESAQADAVPATADSPAATAAEPVAVPLPAMPMASSEPAAAPVGQESVESAAQVASTPEADAAAPQWPEASGADAAADNQSASPASGAGGSNGDALQRARNAYWAGDLDGALAAYKQAAAAHPDDPDVQGELGNIHFAQGNWEPAAAAYLAAGRALLHRGDQAAAEHLVVVLQGLNPEHARSLADELAQQSEGGRQ